MSIKKKNDKIVVEDQELIANNYPIAPPKGVHQLSALVFELRDTVMILSGEFISTPTKEYHSVTGFIHVERKRNYLAIAARFHTLFLEGVPVLGPANHQAARRFVTLIDALYEAGTRLVVLAEAAPEALYREGVGAFEFERTASRLNEMAGADWLARERTA